MRSRNADFRLPCIVALTLASTQLTCAHLARAQTPRPVPVELEWRAPSACPSGAEVVARTLEIVGRPTDGADEVTAVGTVVHEGDQWKLVLELRDGEGSHARSLEARSCQDLARVAALVLAIALEPDQRSASLPVTAAVDPTPPASAEESAPGKLPDASPAPNRVVLGANTESPSLERRLRVRAGLGVALTTGVVDGPAGGLAAWQGVELGRGEMWVHEGLQPPTTVRSEHVPGYGEIAMALGGLRGCYRGWGTRRMSLAGCGGVDLAWLWGRGYGVVHKEAAMRSVTSLALGLQGGVALSPAVGLRVGGDLTAAVARPTFLLDGEPLYEPSWLASRFFLGLEVRFP